MTNYNERLDEILDKFGWACIANGDDGYGLQNEDVSEAKQAITSLTKELVAEAKPENLPIFGSQNEAGDVSPSDYEAAGYNQAIKQFEQNLIKALEENDG